MQTLQQLVARARETKNGFKDLEAAADEIHEQTSASLAKNLAFALLQTDVPQARSIGVFLLGRLAVSDRELLRVMKERISQDGDWRVQEILAKAFDHYCAAIGYEAALPVINEWLSDPSANVRRAVTEGFRIWTGRPYFRDHPEIAIKLLSQFRNDDSKYLRKSVGNALRDISKKHPELVKRVVAEWNLDEPGTKQTHKLATQFIRAG